MAQHDYLIADQSGLSFLSDLNQLTAAIVSNNSGGVEPTDLYAYMWWADTTSGLLKRRNAANNAWIDFASLSTGLIIGTNVQAYDATTVLEADLIASNITNTPVGNITSTNQQDVNNELDAMMYRKNYIINGGFDIWQRGSTRAFQYATYSADRWTMGEYQEGGHEKVTSTINGSPVNAMRVSSSSTAESVGGTRMVVGQMIESENCKSISGQTVTVSAYIKFSSATFTGGGAFNIGVYEYSASDPNFNATSPTSTKLLTLTNGSLPTTWTKISLTTTLAALSTFAVRFFFNIPFNTTNNSDLFYDIAQVQLEKGSVATDFEYRPIGEELALCQRYYEAGTNHVYNGTTGSLTVGIGTRYAVTKRATPSVLTITAGVAESSEGNGFRSYFPGLAAGAWYAFNFTSSAEL